jgi:hypothetical protein
MSRERGAYASPLAKKYFMKIQAFMLSCEARNGLREQTLANLRQTDWQGEVTVVMDASTAQEKQQRITDTAERLMRLALARKDWDYLLFLEDDLHFNRHLRHNLNNWRPLLEGTVQLASLYNPNIPSVFELRSCHYFLAEPHAVFGSQALLLERFCLAYCAQHFGEIEGMQDIRLPLLAGRRGPIFYHRPSLVQHVGDKSEWGGSFHQASDFDAHFRAERVGHVPRFRD